MASGIGYLVTMFYADQLTNQLRHRGTNTDCIGARGLQNDETVYDIPWVKNGKHSNLPFPYREPVRGKGYIHDDTGSEWWEKVHLLPRFLEFGQILTTQSVQIELFNAFRLEDKQLNSIDNNVGEGLNILNVPTLPHTILHLDGLVLTIEVTTLGVPTFDSTVDFNLNIYTLELPVSGLRVIAFPYVPEVPLIERLEFLTDVLPAKNGKEQRMNMRVAPRQSFDIRIIREEVAEKNKIENLLFDWQSRAFGIPIWFEPTVMTHANNINDLTIRVKSTAYADYRIGGLAIVLKDEDNFESLEIASFTPASITFTSGLQSTYPVGTRVYPLRVCITEEIVSGGRYRVNAADYTLRMRVSDNNIDIANASAFSTYDGKVLLDDPNFVPDPTLPIAMERSLIEFDGETGRFNHSSPWDRGKRTSQKGWSVARSRQMLWQVRQLLHFLRGRQISFYLPTFQKEFNVTQQLIIGTTGMVIQNVGYARFVQHRSPNNIFRLTKTNGTQYLRKIVNSAILSDTEETLTVNTSWTENIFPEDIKKIELYELVRWDTDEFRIEHTSALGDATIVAPVKTVFDNI